MSITIYGFGSYFNTKDIFQDIDLLIMHEDSSEDSCKSAIYCKSHLKEKIPSVHVTMLSKAEVASLNFLSKTNFFELGSITYDDMPKDLDHVTTLIGEFRLK